MSQLSQRVKKLEEAQPQPQGRRMALAIPEEGETIEQAVARVRAANPECKKVFALNFVEAPQQDNLPADAEGGAAPTP